MLTLKLLLVQFKCFKLGALRDSIIDRAATSPMLHDASSSWARWRKCGEETNDIASTSLCHKFKCVIGKVQRRLCNRVRALPRDAVVRKVNVFQSAETPRGRRNVCPPITQIVLFQVQMRKLRATITYSHDSNFFRAQIVPHQAQVNKVRDQRAQITKKRGAIHLKAWTAGLC